MLDLAKLRDLLEDARACIMAGLPLGDIHPCPYDIGGRCIACRLADAARELEGYKDLGQA